MKGIIRFLMWILILLLLFIIASFFLPRMVEFQRTATIDANSKIVFNQINDLHNWDKWSIWHQKDTNMVTEYTNHGIGEQAELYWNSTDKKIGEGKMKIVQSTPYKFIAIDLDFLDKGKAQSIFKLEEQNDSTAITWIYKSDSKYNPVARWVGFFMDKIAGKDYEKGLKNLKTVAEMQAQKKVFYIEIDTLESFNYLAKRLTTSKDSLGAAMKYMYEELNSFIQQNDIPVVGAPFSIYHSYSNLGIDVESGIPIGISIMGNGDLIGRRMEQTTCAVLDYYGSYDNMANAYATLENWVQKRKFKVIGQPIERYITDMKNPNSSKLHTKIYFPIRY